MNSLLTKSGRKRQNDETRKSRLVRRKSEKTKRREREQYEEDQEYEEDLGGRPKGNTDDEVDDLSENPGQPRSDAPAPGAAGGTKFFHTPLRRNLAEVAADDTTSSPEPSSEPSDDDLSDREVERKSRSHRSRTSRIPSRRRSVPTMKRREQSIYLPSVSRSVSRGRPAISNRRASMSHAEILRQGEKTREEAARLSTTKRVSTKNFKNLYLEKFTGEENLPGFYGYEDWRAQCSQAMSDTLELDDVYFTDSTRRLLLRFFMQGKAATWYTQQYYEAAPTLAILDRDMKTNFGMANNILNIINTIQRTSKVQTESYEEFARKLKRLARSGASYAYTVVMEAVVRCFAKNASADMSRILLSMIPVHGRTEEFFCGPIIAEMIQKLTSVSGNTGAGEPGAVVSVAINRFNSGKKSETDQADADDNQEATPFTGKCYYCKKIGHPKSECKKLKRVEAARAAADAERLKISQLKTEDFQEEN